MTHKRRHRTVPPLPIVKFLRLHGRKNIDRLRRKGKVWKGKHMRMTYLIKEPVREKGEISERSKLFVGTIASAKLHKSAVKRNRMRRRCREALRISWKAYPANQSTDQGINVLLLVAPRSSSLTCDFGELQGDVQNFLSFLFKTPSH